MKSFVHTVTATASQIPVSKATADSPNPVKVQNLTGSAITAYIGGAGVTTAAGYSIAAGAEVSVELADDELWIIGSGSGTVRVLARYA